MNCENMGIIIQARMTSTRLPGKIMLPVCGAPLLLHQINRIKRTRFPYKIIIATTVNETDDIVVKLAKDNGILFFRGSEDDVLSRYYYAALENGLDTVVRITSDCPLYESAILDEVTDFYLKNDYDYISNSIHRTYPRGLDTEIFTMDALRKSFSEASGQSYREHVTPYIYRNPDVFKIFSYKSSEDHSDLRWTLDTPEDYELIKKIYEYIYPKNTEFTYEDILTAYGDNPEWRSINAEIEQKKVE